MSEKDAVAAAPEEKAMTALPPEALANPWDDRVDQTLPDSPPFIKVLYDNTKGKPEGAANGLLFNNVTGEVMQGMRVLLLYAKVGQIRFPKTFSPDNGFLCRSNDAIVPVGDGDDPQPGPCRKQQGSRLVEVCPYLKWHDGPNGRVPPECPTKYMLLLWDLESQLPVMTTCLRAETAAFRQLKTQLKAKAMRALARHDNPTGIPAFMLMPIDFRTMKKVSQRGVYYPRVFQVLDEKVDLDLARDILTQLAMLKAVADRASVEMDNEVVQEMENDPGDVSGPYPDPF